MKHSVGDEARKEEQSYHVKAGPAQRRGGDVRTLTITITLTISI